jgi:hypothetical protein
VYPSKDKYTLSFIILIKVKAHRTVSGHDFLQGTDKNVQYNISIIFVSELK